MPKEKSNSVKIVLIISAAIIVLAIIGFSIFLKLTPGNTITVNGQGTEKATPDMITIYFDVETKGQTSSEADSANTAIVSKLNSAITSLGFKDEDLKTDNYNIYPQYDYANGQKITGYIASHSLSIEFSVNDRDKIGSVIDAGANAGAGISYINFELSPALEQQYKAQAIKDAAADAGVKAEAMAAGFSKKIGALVSVNLDNFNYYPVRVYDSAVSGSGASPESAKNAVSSSITPSSQDVTASVTAIYKLV